MQPDGRGKPLRKRAALRGEAGDEAAQHVARAGGGEGRRQVPADRGASVRRGDHGIGALEDDDRAREPRRRAGARELVVRGVHAGRAGEQTGEFALVRRHDAAWPPRAISAPSFAASPAKLVSASASRTIVRPPAGRVSAAMTSLRTRGRPRARPERDRPAPLVGEQRLEGRQAGEGRDHHRGQMGGVDRNRIGRARDRDDPGACPQRRARGKPGRARRMGRPGKDERRAARIFVRARPQPRQGVAPESGELTKAFGAMRGRTLAGIPISARRISPQSARPGSSR